MVDLVDRRILGAVRAVDGVSGVPIRHALRLEGTGIGFQRTRSGDYAIVRAEGLGHHVTQFQAPPAAPAPETLPFAVTVHDPGGAYMPRITTIRLPRRFDPGNDIRELMEPILLPMTPAAALAAALSWAVVDALVVDQDGGPIRGALVEVRPQGGGERLGWGLTHGRGEARVPVTGLATFREVENDPNDDSDNEIVTDETTVTVRATADPERPWPVDPDALAAGGGDLRTATVAALALAPGRTDRVALTLDMS